MGVSVKTLRRMLDEGTIPRVRIGRRVVVCHDDLKRRGFAVPELPPKRIVYTADQAADVLRCDTKTVRRLVWSDELTHFYIGRLLRISNAALVALVMKNRG